MHKHLNIYIDTLQAISEITKWIALIEALGIIILNIILIILLAKRKKPSRMAFFVKHLAVAGKYCLTLSLRNLIVSLLISGTLVYWYIISYCRYVKTMWSLVADWFIIFVNIIYMWYFRYCDGVCSFSDIGVAFSFIQMGRQNNRWNIQSNIWQHITLKNKSMTRNSKEITFPTRHMTLVVKSIFRMISCMNIVSNDGRY